MTPIDSCPLAPEWVPPDDPAVIERALALAERLLALSLTKSSVVARHRERRMRRILGTGAGTRFIFGLADRVLRPVDSATGIAQFAQLVSGDLEVLGPVDCLLARAAGRAGRLTPGPVMAVIRARVRHEARSLVFPSEPRRLHHALHRVRRGGGRPNLNVLGEAILGEFEADRHVKATGALLLGSGVDCVSVKVSSVAPGPSLLDTAGSVARATGRLRELYALAAGLPSSALVTLDMEEHRDLHLTVEVLRWALERRELDQLELGIALQAYLPDTHAVVEPLLTSARERVARGGAGLRIRLVKGANLAMERVEAELHGWPPAPYASKSETDASYVRLLDRLLQPDHASWLRLGIATHNIFDLAFAVELAAVRGMRDRVEPEMLAGMADGQAAAVAELMGRVLVYVPVVAARDFHTAIAYLARRLDENATPEGFLRHMLDLSRESEAWRSQRAMFLQAVASCATVSTAPRQTQDRTRRSGPVLEGFANEPDTDLSVPINREWACRALTGGLARVPIAEAGVLDVERAVDRAAASQWSTATMADRRALLRSGAEAIRAGRSRAIGIMAEETRKVFEESDPEVSEAVDYATWYREQTRLFDELEGESIAEPLGVVVVTPPWNFPYAIPAGGVLAALAAANSVILKPSPQARRVGKLLVDQLHEAGVPDDALQLVAAPDDAAGRRLVSHEAVAAVVMTGSWETAKRFASWRPDLRLLGETSGKNAIVVGATADVDQAVRHVVHSAFGHAGQKCSAASLAIVDASVHDRSGFLRQLTDAVSSLRIGMATDPATQFGPIVGPFTDHLERALTRLDPGESWLVRPRCLDGEQRLWSPGVRLGVQPGSWAHMSEWFGPVLGIMRAPDFETALGWQNAVPFGLTAGLESLDRDEQLAWVEAVEAGNLYVNRPTTGAIVGRQPFGGWKRSAFGPTAKTGGPNYLLNLVRWRDRRPAPLDEVERSYRRWWDEVFSVGTDVAGLACEENTLRYRPLPGVVLRATSGCDPDQVDRAVLAARVAGTPVDLSFASPPSGVGGCGSVGTVEDLDSLIGRLKADGTRLRVLGPPEPDLLAAAASAGVAASTDAVSACGRVELPRWLREQLVSRSRHRYGNLVG